MTVKELETLLQRIPEDTPVCISTAERIHYLSGKGGLKTQNENEIILLLETH